LERAIVCPKKVLIKQKVMVSSDWLCLSQTAKGGSVLKINSMSEDPKSSTKYVMVESGPPSDEDEIDLLELIRTLLQAWKTIVGITILCTGLAFAYALYAPEVFQGGNLIGTRSGRKIWCILCPQSVRWSWPLWRGFPFPADSNVEQVVGTLNSRKFLRKNLYKPK
jgi:hypothetical protein